MEDATTAKEKYDVAVFLCLCAFEMVGIDL